MARKAVNGQRKNLVLSMDTSQKISAIREVSGLPSDAEVIRRAVNFYAQVIKFQATGHAISVCMPDENRTILLQHVFLRAALSGAAEETLSTLEISRDALAPASVSVFELA